MDNLTDQNKDDKIKALEIRIAQLEGKIAGSWISYTCNDYEKTVREQIKNDIVVCRCSS